MEVLRGRERERERERERQTDSIRAIGRVFVQCLE